MSLKDELKHLVQETLKTPSESLRLPKIGDEIYIEVDGVWLESKVIAIDPEGGFACAINEQGTYDFSYWGVRHDPRARW